MDAIPRVNGNTLLGKYYIQYNSFKKCHLYEPPNQVSVWQKKKNNECLVSSSTISSDHILQRKSYLLLNYGIVLHERKFLIPTDD